MKPMFEARFKAQQEDEETESRVNDSLHQAEDESEFTRHSATKKTVPNVRCLI